MEKKKIKLVRDCMMTFGGNMINVPADIKRELKLVNNDWIRVKFIGKIEKVVKKIEVNND